MKTGTSGRVSTMISAETQSATSTRTTTMSGMTMAATTAGRYFV